MARASPPAARMAAAVVSADAGSRSLTTTWAPSWASAKAPARPRPEPAPVTRAIRFARRMAARIPQPAPGQIRRRPTSRARARLKRRSAGEPAHWACPPALGMAIARARLLGKERRLLVAAVRRGSRRAAGALLDAIAVVEGALVEGRLHVRRAHVQVIEPSDACFRCATQGIWLVAARGHSGLELVGRGLGAGRAVGIGSGHAAIQDGLTAVGTGLTGTEAGGAVPGILIQPISPQLPEVVRELLAGIVEA